MQLAQCTTLDAAYGVDYDQEFIDIGKIVLDIIKTPASSEALVSKIQLLGVDART